MRKQAGFAMPGTLILLFLLMSFFIYETNMLLSDKNFYIEAEQNFALEEMVNQVILDVKADLQNKEVHDTFSFVYEKGEASGRYVFEKDVVFVELQCSVKPGRLYKASFQYDTVTKKIINWLDER
ncbi:MULTISPECIES: competence type IV pilus minor pilin ComGG [unclassified Bacillus cereus group]|uniref:competence type IV pilus minor pilin ComGG n=1 Tax=unclassified Bacillus cereus group TaxID=2750818 RepID=UPI001F5AF0E3|nr:MULTISPECIES: competence type IV pilus minor pilin ComGG [unclassified Bacillus cereus group]